MQSTQSTPTTNQRIKAAHKRLSHYDNFDDLNKLTVLSREFCFYGDRNKYTRNAVVSFGMFENHLSSLYKTGQHRLDSIVRSVGIVRTFSDNLMDESGTDALYRFVFNRPVLKRKLDMWKKRKEVVMIPNSLSIYEHDDCPQYVVVVVRLKTESPYEIDFKGDLVSVVS